MRNPNGITLLVLALLTSCATSGPARSPELRNVGGDLSVFPPQTGEEEVYLSDAPGLSKSSLSMWGNPIDAEIDRIFKIASAYQDQGRFEEAQVLFNYAIRFAAKKDATLSIEQFDNILLRRAYALADSDRMDDAIALYDLRLSALQNDPAWRERIPAGLRVVNSSPQSTIDALTAMTLQDRAVGLTVVREFDAAWDDAQAAVDLFLSGDNREKAAETLAFFIMNAAGLEAWAYAVEGLALYRAIASDAGDMQQLFTVHRSAAQAYVNLGNLRAGHSILDGLVRLSERTGYRDEMTATDRMLRDQLAEYVDQFTSEPTTLAGFAQAGDVEAVRRLLAEGEDPNVQDDEGFTPLMLAARDSESLEVVEALIGGGADPAIQGINGITALALAGGCSGSVEIVRILLEAGADPNTSSDAGWTTLMLAVRSGDSPMVDILLDAGADPNSITNSGVTALQLAEDMGHRRIAARLVDAGANR